MRHVGLLGLGMMAAAVVACATNTAPGAQDAQEIVETTADASAPDSSSSDATAPTTTDASAPDSTADASAPATPTYDEVAPLIQTACGGCHHDQFAEQETVDGNAASMLSMINRGRMPKGNPTWKDSPDGKKVVAYLTSVQ